AVPGTSVKPGLDNEAASIVVVGCGVVGLPLAVAFADRGCSVLGYDIDKARIADLARGRGGASERGLTPALRRALAGGTLAFDTALNRASVARVSVLAPRAPASAGAGFDAGPLQAAMAAVDRAAADGDLVCIRSTAPIGAARAFAQA